ncbi:hypothetical protein FQZ97_450200 [compost metagenome]
MPVQLDVVDARVGTHELQDDLQLGPGHVVQRRAAAGKAQLQLLDLVEIDRQQLGGTGQVVVVGLAEFHRQQPHFQGFAALQGAMADQRAAAVEQAGQQAPGLQLAAVERHVTARDADHAEIDIAAPGLPRRGSGQQGRRPSPQPALPGLQAEGRLLAGASHELADAEIGDGLRQAALELIALDLPLHLLEAGLEGDGLHRQARQQADQDEVTLAHGELHGNTAFLRAIGRRRENLKGVGSFPHKGINTPPARSANQFATVVRPSLSAFDALFRYHSATFHPPGIPPCPTA